jgi:hypothetical protein
MTTIKLKKNSTSGEAPSASDLAVGEVAVNTADGLLYTKHTDNSIKTIGGGTDYSLPLATDTTLGGIELFSDTDQTVAANTVTTTASRTYGVQLNSDNQAVVNVPWVDTNTDTDTVYTHPNHTGEVTSTADGATVIADNVVDEANLKVSNSPTNGYFLSAQSGTTGGLTWAAASGGGGGFDSDLTIYARGANYTIVAGDAGKIISHESGDVTFTFTAAATLGAGWHCWVKNRAGAADVTTFDFNGSEKLDGRGDGKLFTGESIHVYCDGSNFHSVDRTIMWAGNTATDYFAQPQASGGGSIAAGLQAVSGGSDSVAIGYSTTASHTNSSAIGYGAQAFNTRAMALGWSRASGNDSLAAAIGTSSGSYGALGANSVAMGYQAKASASKSIALGYKAIASANGAKAFGGFGLGVGTTASAEGSTAIGDGASSTVSYKTAITTRPFAALGDAQAGIFVIKAATTDATPTALTSDSNSVGSGNQVILPNNSVYGFTGTITARENSAQTNDFAVWEVKGGAVRAASAATTALGSYNINTISESTGAANWSIAISADTTNGAIAFTVTGEASHSIRWVATINTTEVTY